MHSVDVIKSQVETRLLISGRNKLFVITKQQWNSANNKSWNYILIPNFTKTSSWESFPKDYNRVLTNFLQFNLLDHEIFMKTKILLDPDNKITYTRKWHAVMKYLVSDCILLYITSSHWFTYLVARRISYFDLSKNIFHVT